MKVLSVIVPSYNMEKYLSRCLGSMVSETILDKIEILVINDGSKDGTLEIAQSYRNKYPNTFVVVDKDNGGHGSTINKGIELANGKYFKVVDADDWVDTEALSQLVGYLENCQSDVVLTHLSRVYNDYNLTSVTRFENVEFKKQYTFADLVLRTIIIKMPNITYKTKILKDKNIRLQENTFYVDNEFNLLPVPYIKSIEFLDLTIYYYFLGRSEQSISRINKLKNYEHTVRVIKRLIEYYNETEFDVEQKEYYRNYLNRQISNTYKLFSTLPDKAANNIMRIRGFDIMIKTLNEEIYNNVSNLFVKLLRKSNFTIIRVLNIAQLLKIFGRKFKKLFYKLILFRNKNIL